MPHTKKLLNGSEAKTRAILNQIVALNGAEIFPKQRIADVLEINQSGLSKEDYSYALKAHFDFVVAESDFEPLFAVEFDGPHHRENSRAAINDEKKDRICRHLNFPLLRINSMFLTKEVRQFNLLSWLIDLWFTEREFDRLQEAGQIPYDEPFMYFNIMAMAGERKVSWPYDLSRPLRVLMHEACSKNLIKDCCPSVVVVEGANKIVSAIAMLRIDDEKALVGRSECRLYQFSPISSWELCEELAIIEVGEKVKAYFEKRLPPIGIEEAQQEILLVRKLSK
ncbi:DUF2726 domain-containing protein [bacterium]|nr:MAG: DUF2726 domain-containing protein [bacterium]